MLLASCIEAHAVMSLVQALLQHWMHLDALTTSPPHVCTRAGSCSLAFCQLMCWLLFFLQLAQPGMSPFVQERGPGLFVREHGDCTMHTCVSTCP